MCISLLAQMVKNLPAMWENRDRGSGRSPGEGNGNPLQYSCLDNSIDRGAWGCNSPWGCKEPDTAEWLTLSLFLLKIRHFDFYEYAFLKSNASKWIRFKMFFFFLLNNISERFYHEHNWRWKTMQFIWVLSVYYVLSVVYGLSHLIIMTNSWNSAVISVL